jgi:hypothetical protein
MMRGETHDGVEFAALTRRLAYANCRFQSLNRHGYPLLFFHHERGGDFNHWVEAVNARGEGRPFLSRQLSLLGLGPQLRHLVKPMLWPSINCGVAYSAGTGSHPPGKDYQSPSSSTKDLAFSLYPGVGNTDRAKGSLG